MRFGPVATEDAEGTVLAHALRLKSGRLKKGKRLSSTDVAAALDSGVKRLVVARIEAGDIEEDCAAEQLGRALRRDGMRTADPFTGRVNVYAECAGIFTADAELVAQLNRVDPDITFATLPDQVFVQAGRMVATVKIISFAVNQEKIKEAVELCKGANHISLKRSEPTKVGLIATKLPTLKMSTMDKTATILRERLELAGSSLVAERRVDHTASAVSEALSKMVEQTDLIIVFGASAITDRADVIPSGLRDAGGLVETLGMPVDPGNLLMTGRLDQVPVIGAPGCARSPAENGFDWVLQRMLAGLDVGPDYITGLGVGGLLMEIHERPQPREG